MKKFSIIIPFLLLFFGLFCFFFPVLINSSLLPGDLGDARLINYILEHGYKFFIGDDFHSSLFNMPFFFPNKNTLFYSDVLLGGMLIYTPIRHFINSPFTALQIWLTVLCILNYFSFYFLSKNVFKFDIITSSISAFLFAFALPRHIQMSHLQLYTQFLMIFGLYFFLNNKKSYFRFILSSVFFVLQFYTSFYFGWFSTFGGTLCIIIMLSFSNTRKILFDFILENKRRLIAFVLTFIILIIPLAYKYISVGASGFGYYDYFLFNKYSFITSSSALDKIFYIPHNINVEKQAGIGILTTTMLIFGLFGLKKYRLQIALFVFITAAFFWLEPYNYFLYLFFPGGNVIRAGGRVIFLILIPFSYLIGVFFEKIKPNLPVFLFILSIFLLEQVPSVNVFHWNKNIQAKRINSYNINKNCKLFLIEPENRLLSQTDAIWLTEKVRIPTVNGYSGYIPKIQKDLTSKECRYSMYYEE